LYCFQESDGSTQNVELDKGTVDLYQPNYNKNDGISQDIFARSFWANDQSVCINEQQPMGMISSSSSE
jgi:hypothetical protein